MDYILNELSINQVDSKKDAKTIISGFVETCFKAKHELFLETLRVPESVGNLYNIFLCAEYPVSKWLHDHEIDFDIRQNFYQVLATPPLIKDIEIKELDTFNSTYFYYQEKEAKGLGAAYLLQTLAISFLSDSLWDTDEILILHEQIDVNGDVIKPSIPVVHGAKSEHILSHKQNFIDLRNSLLTKCSYIWNKREELFPNLIFCGKTKKQLNKGLSSRYVHQIYDRLTALNEYLNSWIEGEFNYSDFINKHNVNCSPESDSTMRLYGDQRRFSLPDSRSE
jgi:hypothetical protein